MKVTAIIRTCNRPEYLKEALVSIQLQTHKDWEVIIFDDGATEINFLIYKTFKKANPNNKVMYITTGDAYDLFKNSWLIAPDIAGGEIMVRVDDDDILATDTFEFISEIYSKNPELDFSYGSSVFFNEDGIVSLIETKNPFEHEKSKDIWAPYTIPNNKPWKEPWMWYRNYYEYPQPYTSIIHAAKANQMSVYHTYVMRTSAVKKVKDKITMTTNFVDDLEFFGSLDYLGLGHNSLKKILTFVRMHNSGKVSDYNKEIFGKTMFDENFRVRDKVDEIRPSGFFSKIVPLHNEKNKNNGIDEVIIDYFNELQSKIAYVLGTTSNVKLGNVSVKKV
jgi:glycosyltransferase involved in cell wall biosynthesis